MNEYREDKFIDNVIDLEARVKLRRKEPPDGNWLSKLESGCRFLGQRKQTADPELMDFLVASHPDKMPAVLLGYELNTPQGGFKWVDPVLFSQKYGCYMILETELEDGNSPPVEAGRMGSDEGVEVIDPVHEK